MNVKFTLRVSVRLERYLNWMAANKNKKKAEYLRSIVIKMLKTDEPYKRYLAKNRQ